MTAVPIMIGRRPRTTGRPIARRSPAPTALVFIDDIDAAASANVGRCNDSNPYN